MIKNTLLVLSFFAWGVVLASDLSTIPAAAKTTILKYGTAKEITDIEEDVEKGVKVYFVTIEKADKYIYLTVDKAGKLISKEEEAISEDDYSEEEEEEEGDED